MLDTNRQQSARLHLLHGAVAIEESNAYVLCALHLFVVAGHRQATLIADDDPILFENLRIYQHVRLRLVRRYIGDQQAQVHVHLGRGQTNSRRAYIVSNISSINARSASSTSVTGVAFVLSLGSGNSRIVSFAIIS